MIGALFILTSKGDLLLSRVYRDDVSRTVADAFKQHIILGPGHNKLPANNLGSSSFLHVLMDNLYFVAITTKNANAVLVFQLLHKFIAILKSYMPDLNPDTVRNSFVLIYELMDEILDFGYPQTTDIEALKSYITQGNTDVDKLSSVEEVKKITIQATGARGNRPEGIRYRENAVYLEVVESVNMLVSAKGAVLRSDVSGQIVVRGYLSGMPECMLILNDKLVVQKPDPSTKQARRSRADIQFDDITFHPCVKLSNFERDRSILFSPPDGEFELMKYRTSDGVQLPFRIIPSVKEISRTRLSVNVTIKSSFPRSTLAENVVLKIPTPPNTASARITVFTGKAKYDATVNALVWKIRDFPGLAESRLSAEVELISSTSGKSNWSRPPISVDFVVPMFASSGLQIEKLEVIEKSEYKVAKWARSVTKSGTYQHRI